MRARRCACRVAAGLTWTMRSPVRIAAALVEQGRFDEASAVLQRLGPLAARPAYYALDVQARLARTVEAADAAGAVWRAYGIDNPGLSSWRNARSLALFAAGDVAAAAETAREDLGIAERWGCARAHGRSLRTLGQITSSAVLLRQSVEILEGSPARLELAYSLAALGAFRRRAGQRRDARDPLHRALDLAEVCGAAPLVQQVRTELRTAGFRPRRDRLTGVDALTPSERRVAELAADGASNRDVAQHLFITTKTVEVHLTSAYRKLGVNRRVELAKALSSGS